MAKQNNKVASLPAKKQEKKPEVEYVDVTEMIEEFKKVELMKIDHMITKQCPRIDFWMDIRLAADQYFHEEYELADSMISELAQILCDVYGAMRATVANLIEDDFVGDLFDDLYGGLYKSWQDIPTNLHKNPEFFYQYVIYQHVAPFGAQLERLYLAIQDALGPVPEKDEK